jgi:ABC-type multidrug transport system ATPase subunit
MRGISKGRTVFIIAHRLSTVRDSDRIITIEAGEIVEDGSHNDLLKSGGRYARLWAAQARGTPMEAVPQKPASPPPAAQIPPQIIAPRPAPQKAIVERGSDGQLIVRRPAPPQPAGPTPVVTKVKVQRPPSESAPVTKTPKPKPVREAKPKTKKSSQKNKSKPTSTTTKKTPIKKRPKKKAVQP